MRLFKLNGITKKIIFLVSLIITISLLGISTLNYQISKNELSRSNQIILSNAIESTMVEINKNYGYSADYSGWMSEEEAKTASLASIGVLTEGTYDGLSGATSAEIDAISTATINSIYANHHINLGESGYFYIINSQGDIIYHPFLEDNIYKLQSQDERYIIKEVIERAKSGGGITNYVLDDDIGIINDSKTVYSKYFPHWDWVVSAVIYDTELARGSNIILSYNMIGILTILAIAIFITVLITKRITKPIKKISKALYEISEGNLTIDEIHINTRDETKELSISANRLIKSLSKIIRLMINSSDKLNQYADRLKQSSGMVSKSTTEVANTISQIAIQSDDQFRDTLDSVNMLTLLGDNIEKTADESTKISSVVNKSLELKKLGESSVLDLKNANKENNDNSVLLGQLVHRINEQSKDISEITSIISNVANQTNLLALNASIEASRAGEHGSGFSVVAEEIRKLANETAEATDNISNKISLMQSQSEEAVSFIDKNRSGVEKINLAVSQTEDIIGKIANGLQELFVGIKVITDHNYEINHKKDEVLIMLDNVSHTAQENSAAIEEVSASAEEQSMTIVEITESILELNDMVNDLNSLINEFKVEK